MNLPATLNPSKGAADVEAAADLLAAAGRLLDNAERHFRGTDFEGSIEKIPGTTDICSLLAERLQHLATSIFETEGF